MWATNPSAHRFGVVDTLELLRWQDASGARLVFGVANGDLIDFLPSFASTASVRLRDLRRANADVVVAAVVDDDGEQLTSLAFECEQMRLVPTGGVESALASLVLLGRQVSVHTDAASFGADPASLLDPDADPDAPPPRGAARLIGASCLRTPLIRRSAASEGRDARSDLEPPEIPIM